MAVNEEPEDFAEIFLCLLIKVFLMKRSVYHRISDHSKILIKTYVRKYVHPSQAHIHVYTNKRTIPECWCRSDCIRSKIHQHIH